MPGARLSDPTPVMVQPPHVASDRPAGAESSARDAITVSRVGTIEELEDLREPWNDLLRQSPANHLFLSHDWIRTWWKHFGGGRTLFTLVFRRGGRLIGVAPLLIEKKRRRGLPTRQIGQLVNGCAQQSGLIVPAHKRDIFHAFYRHLQDCADQWDVVDLGGLSEASGDLPDLEAAAAVSTISAARRWQFETISLEYDGQAEDFIKSRSVNFRRKLRSAEKRLNELGSVRLRRFTSPEELESSFARLLDVECRSWKVEGGTAILNQPGWLEFYRDIVQIFGRSGACQIRMIEVDGRPVAGNLVVVYDGVVYGLRMFIDQSLARASLGTSLIHFLVTDAWAPGIRAVELDRRTPFLSRWSNRSEVYHGVFLFHGGLYSRLLRGLHLTSSAARALRRPKDRTVGTDETGAD